MESVDKLRVFCDKLRNVDDNHVSAEYVAERCAIDVRRMADEIEREIAERYVELPLDADGVPIRVGDVVRINGLSGTLPVGGIGCGRVWFMHNGNAEFTTIMNVHHFKPRTVEDVLREFAQGVQGQNADFADLAAKQYADELRELMGVE